MLVKGAPGLHHLIEHGVYCKGCNIQRQQFYHMLSWVNDLGQHVKQCITVATSHCGQHHFIVKSTLRLQKLWCRWHQSFCSRRVDPDPISIHYLHQRRRLCGKWAGIFLGSAAIHIVTCKHRANPFLDSFTVSLHSPNGGQSATVQRDCQ